MDKRKIEAYLPAAAEQCRGFLVKNPETGVEELDFSLRGQISSFGAAVEMGSLLAAIAFFTEKGKAESERQLLIPAIEKMLGIAPDDSLFAQAQKAAQSGERWEMQELKENVLACAVAIKLAMNLFPRKEKDSSE